MSKLLSTNPAKNYEVVGEVRVSTKEEITKKVKLARAVLPVWKDLGAKKRAEMLAPLVKMSKKRKKEIEELTVAEIGKPVKDFRFFFDWDVSYLEDFLKDGPKYLADTTTQKTKNSYHRIVYEPIGVAAVIVPWNFPYANFMWGVVPNLIAGNTVVFKHSEECPLMGRLMGEFMEKLKLPTGVFSQVYGDGTVGETLVKDDIDLVWFTGSSSVGKRLFDIAGKKFIRSTLELGGSNPAVVFEDVDIDEHIDQLVNGRFLNNGQVCDAIKRLIVHESKFDEVVQKVTLKVQNMKIGDPSDSKTDIGSLAAKRQLELLESQVTDAVEKNAVVVCGGKRPERLTGAYYEPTILTNISTDMRVWTEEVFGPVLPVISFATEDEAVKLANDTEYGLGSLVLSKDLTRAKQVASRIQAGCVDINHGNHWFSCNPFGGYKASGMGREHGEIGFRELTQVKVVSVG